MSFDLQALRHAVAAHGVVGRIVVADHAGSVPREAGAAMLVWPGGQSGTIGGGALEFEAAARLRGRFATATAKAYVERLPLGPALGQCCGGSVTLVCEVFDAETLPGAQDPVFARRIEGPQEVPLVISRALAQARSCQSDKLAFSGGWLAEPVATAATPLWIYGAGHVGRAIVDVMAPLPGFAITWIDTAAQRFPDRVPEGVTMLPTPDPAASVVLAPAKAHHLVLTYSHALDLEICHRLLRHGFGFAGLIGSQTKWARFRKRLGALGHSDAQTSSIRCPIGRPELGKHPQAIALGVAAQLILSSADACDTGGRATA